MLDIKHLLVVDDDDRIRSLLVKFLNKEGYFVSCAASAIGARGKLENHVFDLIIVDVMMPNETGVEFTQWVRKTSKVPILMLTAMGEVEDVITGFDSGADDYMPKPFDPRELLARIRRILHRHDYNSDDVNNISFGDIIYEISNKTLIGDNSTNKLSSNEYLLLDFLIDNKNNVVTRTQLSQLSGGVSERSIDVQINRLRAKIEKNPKNPIFLKTIRGKGYMVNV